MVNCTGKIIYCIKIFAEPSLMNKYQHLFFDLDHTLWDFDSNARATLTSIYSQFNLQSRVNAGFDDFYQKYLFHNHELWERYHKGLISAEDLKWKRMWRTMLDFKLADEPLARELSAAFHVITSEGSNSLKPKKEIFEYAMNKAGANVSQSIMIGDNLDADIQGGMNAGMDTIFVNHIKSDCPISPTYTVTHLQQLEDIF